MSLEPDGLTRELITRVERAMGSPVASTRPIDRGYTAALRCVVALSTGKTVFAKMATTEDTARWLRAEHSIYCQVEQDFMPSLVGWVADETHPLLILEDLSHAAWPPPWTKGQIESVLATLTRVAATPLPKSLPDLRDLRADLAGWRIVESDPDAFLSLGLCSRGWLDRSLPGLLASSESAELDGDELLHLDIRSDNICIADEGVRIVDWNYACRGNAAFDLAAWLPSLAMEGGPWPSELIPDSKGYAALLAGYWAARAGLPILPQAPETRGIQLKQLRVALPWAVEELGFQPLDGAVAAS